jgi:hypothetical protein
MKNLIFDGRIIKREKVGVKEKTRSREQERSQSQKEYRK